MLNNVIVVKIDRNTPSEKAMDEICTVADQIEWADVEAGIANGSVVKVGELVEWLPSGKDGDGSHVLAFTVYTTPTQVWVTSEEDGATDGMTAAQFSDWFGADIAQAIGLA